MLNSTAEVLCPTSLADALALKAAHPQAVPLAGGTDLMVGLELGALNPAMFLDLWGIRGALNQIEDEGEHLAIGALSTHTQLIQSERLKAVAPALVEAARTVGAHQIQNRGTLGGNVANASPAGDTLPPLLALDAEVELKSAARGARRLPLAAFFLGYRKLDLAPDELLTRVLIPTAVAGSVQHFRKVGTRQAQSISKVSLAARLTLTDGVVTEARVAFGSVAATPVRAPAVEAALLGHPVDPRAAAKVRDDLKPIDDIRSTGAYRLLVAKNILEGWLNTLV